jgi:hypothetical protein
MVHYARNLLGMVSYASRKELGADLRAIFSAPAKGQVLQIASSVAQKWRRKKVNEKLAEHIEEHLEECLTCLAFPESHRRRIRTTNGLERLNLEIKRRTRVVRIFPNREACLRLVTALAVEQSEEWVTGRRYLDMRELEEYRQEDEREAEGVVFMKGWSRDWAWRKIQKLRDLTGTHRSSILMNTAVGNRDANQALYVIALGRISCNQRTRTYVALGSAEGKSKREIICCPTATAKSIDLEAFMDQAASDYILAVRVWHAGSIIMTHAVNAT